MWTAFAVSQVISTTSGTEHLAEVSVDPLMVFGFVSTFLTLVFFIYQGDSKLTRRIFAVCLAGSATYGFLQGTWALGIIVMVWSIAALWRSFERREAIPASSAAARPLSSDRAETVRVDASRISRMFGPTESI